MIKFPDFSSECLRSIDLTTVAIQNQMHVISHCNTHTYSHNYDNYILCAKRYLVQNSLLAYFVSRTILTAIDHMQEHS